MYSSNFLRCKITFLKFFYFIRRLWSKRVFVYKISTFFRLALLWFIILNFFPKNVSRINIQIFISKKCKIFQLNSNFTFVSKTPFLIFKVRLNSNWNCPYISLLSVRIDITTQPDFEESLSAYTIRCRWLSKSIKLRIVTYSSLWHVFLNYSSAQHTGSKLHQNVTYADKT